MIFSIPLDWDADLWTRARNRIDFENSPETQEAMTVYRAWFYAGEKFGWTEYRMQMFKDAAEWLKKAIKK